MSKKKKQAKQPPVPGPLTEFDQNLKKALEFDPGRHKKPVHKPPKKRP